MIDTNRDVFASLATRIKAGVIDGIILLILFISIPMVINTFFNSNSQIRAIVMFAPILFLEPILVSFSGATIGQHAFGMEVVRSDSRSNCPLHVAFLRYLAKAILGSISLVYMLFSKKHQAIHDHLAKTVVLISQTKLEKNPKLVKYGEMEQTLNYGYSYPSAYRRFAIFIVWYIVVSIFMGFLFEIDASFTILGHTTDSHKLSELLEIFESIVFTVVFIVMAVFASKGMLPGAKRKRI